MLSGAKPRGLNCQVKSCKSSKNKSLANCHLQGSNLWSLAYNKDDTPTELIIPCCYSLSFNVYNQDFESLRFVIISISVVYVLNSLFENLVFTKTGSRGWAWGLKGY